MKKSELKQVIRECIEEVINEATLVQDVGEFFKTLNPELQTPFKELIWPLLQKSSENKTKKARYVVELINAISHPESAHPTVLNLMQQHDVDLRANAKELNTLLPLLSTLKTSIDNQK